MKSRRRELEDDRLTSLFAIPTGIALFIYWEMGRRQRLGELREESRRNYVDGELAELHRVALEAKARAEGAAEASKVRAERESRRVAAVATIATVLAVLITAIAYHVI